MPSPTATRLGSEPLPVDAKKLKLYCEIGGNKKCSYSVEQKATQMMERMQAALSKVTAVAPQLLLQKKRQLIRFFGDYILMWKNVFGFGGPIDDATIATIKQHCPDGIVEIGGGLGHWARALANAGIPIASFDRCVNWQCPAFFPVQAGGPEVLPSYAAAGLTLLLVWPPCETGSQSCGHGSMMAAECLEHSPKRVIFAGRGSTQKDYQANSSAGPRFFKLLKTNYRLVKEIQLQGFPDGLYIYQDGVPQFCNLVLDSTLEIWERTQCEVSTEMRQVDVQPVDKQGDFAAELKRAETCRCHTTRIILNMVCCLVDIEDPTQAEHAIDTLWQALLKSSEDSVQTEHAMSLCSIREVLKLPAARKHDELKNIHGNRDLQEEVKQLVDKWFRCENCDDKLFVQGTSKERGILSLTAAASGKQRDRGFSCKQVWHCSSGCKKADWKLRRRVGNAK